MRLASDSNLLALLAITALTDALPFIPKPRSNRPLARRDATYSVVPVDGGSTGAAAPTTVTEPASTLPPVTETQLSTLLSTIVVTAFEIPTTIVISITETPSAPSSTMTSIESTPAPSYSELTTTTTATSEATEVMTMTNTMTSASTEYVTLTTTTTSAYTELITMMSVTTPAAVVTVTTLPPEVITVTASPSSMPYDNGMWHTTYYHPVYEASPSSSSFSSETSTTSFYPYPGTVTSSSTAVPSLDTNVGIPWNATWALGARDNVARTPTPAIPTPTHIITVYHPTVEKE